MKLFKFIFYISLLFLPCIKILAINIERNGIYYTLYADEAFVIDRKAYDSLEEKYFGDIIIPQSVDYEGSEYIVTGISNSAFEDCKELKSVSLPNTLNFFGSFKGCSKLQHIEVPEPVNSICDLCFKDCSSLKSISFGKNITSFGQDAFDGCTNLQSVHISDLSQWCKISFSKIKRTGNIYNDYYAYVSNPLSMGANLYLNNEIVEELVIPEDISEISSFAFIGCGSIKKIILNQHVIKVGVGAFSNCGNLEEVDNYSNCFYDEIYRGICSLQSPFCGCNNLKIVKIKDIEEAAEPRSYYNNQTFTYKSCNEYISLLFPCVQEIEIVGNPSIVGKCKFINCTCLEKIIIPNSICEFGERAFDGCEKLKSVFISDLEAWCNMKFSKKNSSAYLLTTYDFTSNPLQNGADLYVNGEKIVNFVVPNTISKIPHFAFRGCSSFETITIPENVEVAEGAFSNNMNLKELYAYGKCDSYECFAYCTSLETVYIVSQISEKTFIGSTNITKVHIVNSDGIGGSNSGFLSMCFPNVKEFVLQEGIKRIGQYAFKNCQKLESINIPSSVQIISNNVFDGCNNLKSVYIEDLANWFKIVFGESYYVSGSGTISADPKSANPLNTGADLYVNGEKLIDCVIPSQVTEVQEGVFYGYKGIESLNIHENVKKIGSSAFCGCKNLSHVNILSKSPIEMGVSIFDDCEKLTSAGPLNSNCSIEYGWDFEIPQWAFSYSNVQKIIIPSTIQIIDNYVFYFAPVSYVYMYPITPPTISDFVFTSYKATLFVPRDCKEAYSNAPYWKNFNIIELVDVESVTLGKEKYDVIVGESKTIDVTILPEKATYKDLYWSIEDPEIAQVDNGVVVGLKTGTTKLTATTTDGTNISASCVISVTNPVQSIVLSKDYVELEAEDTETITATCSPANADDITVTWRSMNGSVATVTNGVVKAVKVGETDIVAQSVSGIEAKCRVVVKPTIATSLSLNKHSLNLNTGNTEKLELDILPLKTTNKSVSWRSDAPTVASVDDSGLVTAKSNGTAKITVTTTDGSNISEECTVMVTTLATGISLNKENSSLIVGQTLSLTADIAPTETSNKSVKWESNNTSCATVSPTGLVTALATGTATISATTKDGTAKSASCVVVVTNPVISLTLDKTVAEMKVGQHITITATCVPSNADNTNVTWRSSNEDVASVDNGIVTAKKLGNVTITASSVNGLEAKCSINVVPTPVTSLSINKTSINLAKGNSYELVCTVFPDDATNKEIVWKSNDSSVAVVDNGIVTAVSTGSTSIVATSKSNSNLSVSCRVIVTTPIIALNLDYEAMDLYVEDNVQLRATCSPNDADNKTLTWSSNNEDVATVSSNGHVSTKNEGKALITATTTDGSNISASCDINVKKREQNITWNQDLSLIMNGGEMILLDANASSDLPVSFVADNNNVVSIFDIGDKVYLNPIGCGKTYISAYQQGNYKYESTELRKDIEVIGNVATKAKTLVVYYSQSPLIDDIVAELANQLSGLGCSVNMQKIEPTNGRVNEANVNKDVRDSVMTVIGRFPNDLNSYPSINGISVNINEYDDVIMVYPLWNSEMAAPMQTFSFMNKDILRGKSFAYIEYDLFGDAGSSSNIKTLRLNTSNIDDKSDIIREWLNSESTGILQFRAINDKLSEGIYDLQGRKISKFSEHGVNIINGKKIIIR